jgi:hypothetical protein
MGFFYYDVFKYLEPAQFFDSDLFIIYFFIFQIPRSDGGYDKIQQTAADMGITHDIWR